MPNQKAGDSRLRQKRLLPAKSITTLPKLPRPVSEAVDRICTQEFGSATTSSHVQKSTSDLSTVAFIRQNWTFTPSTGAAPVRSTLPEPKPYHSVRTCVTGTPVPDKGRTEVIREALANLNGYSLSFSQLLRELTPGEDDATSSKLADVWAQAMETMLTAIQAAGSVISDERRRRKKVEEEMLQVRRENKATSRDKENLSNEVKRLKSEIFNQNMRMRFSTQNVDISPSQTDSQPAGSHTEPQANKSADNLQTGEHGSYANSSSRGTSPLTQITPLTVPIKEKKARAVLPPPANSEDLNNAHHDQTPVPRDDERLKQLIPPYERSMENTSTEKGIQVQVDEGTDDFPGTKKRDRKLMLRKGWGALITEAPPTMQNCVQKSQEAMIASSPSSPKIWGGSDSKHTLANLDRSAAQGKVGEDDRGSLSTPLPSMPVQSEMPLAILHEHIVYLLLYLQDTKPQIYMGELYMGKAVDQDLELSRTSPSPVPNSPMKTFEPESRPESSLSVITLGEHSPGAKHSGLWKVPPMEQFLREWLYLKHSSRALADKHFTDLSLAVHQHHVESPLVHTFGRLCGLFDKLLPAACRFVFSVLAHTMTGQDSWNDWTFNEDHSPLVTLPAAIKALNRTFSNMGTDPPYELAEGIKSIAFNVCTESGERPHVELGQLLDEALGEWKKHRVRSYDYLQTMFYARYPKGEALLQYSEFTDLLHYIAPQCPPVMVSKMFRLITEEAVCAAANAVKEKKSLHHAGQANKLTADVFINFADKYELLAWSAKTPEEAMNGVLCVTEPPIEEEEDGSSRPESTVSPSGNYCTTLPRLTVEAMISFRVLEYVWHTAKRGLEEWMGRWRLAGQGMPVIMQPQTEDARKRVLDLVVKLKMQGEEASNAVDFARLQLQNGGNIHDVDMAWKAYTTTVCALEEAVLEHRSAIGIHDTRIWLKSSMRVAEVPLSVHARSNREEQQHSAPST
ncbi:hypothetical protein CYMTET_55027 [Cymbomonas tetramitiformis]|uniref:Uncharacterized protein n=1 Tax=Cymbomonas tetramitiformis TaxID=36881 RepID=A0AAE0BFK2_9CHLO|nr:hypothetical protein CYMTET_55027 [Cymbomonas tetramitiformis]